MNSRKTFIILPAFILVLGFAAAAWALSPIPHPKVAEDYLNSSFRVLFVKKHPKQPYFFVVATERSTDKSVNDGQCGSIYTQPTCYFFVERDYDVASPDTHFVAEYDGTKGSTGLIRLNTIRFKDKNNVEFRTREGDAGWGVDVKWRLNVETGVLKEISRKEIRPE